MEPLFGNDFSQVRVHRGGVAEESARAVAAQAYTVGSHIVFGEGRFSPGTPAGQRLLAHELAHVVQQSEESEGLQRQPASNVTKARSGREIPATALYDPPAGVGLRVPIDPHAVQGIDDWGQEHAVMFDRANSRNSFAASPYHLSQICHVDDSGKSRVHVYYVTREDKKYAVGPDSLFWFVLHHGGVLIASPRNTDQVDAEPVFTVDARNLPTAANAFREEPQIVYAAPALPRCDEKGQSFQLSIYHMQPYLRRLPKRGTGGPGVR